MKRLERKAMIFAKRAHADVNQVRKYTGQPYIVHPAAVAAIVKTVPHTDEMIAAALLHDTVEDTRVSLPMIRDNFGPEIADLVYWLTDISKPEDGNREARKAIDREHIGCAPAAAQTIKIADLIDNTDTIRKYDPDFWKVYRREKLLLLELMGDGDRVLWRRAMEMCE